MDKVASLGVIVSHKGLFVRVQIFNIESKFKTGFEKSDMHVVIYN
jgi:hypothetical protein